MNRFEIGTLGLAACGAAALVTTQANAEAHDDLETELATVEMAAEDISHNVFMELYRNLPLLRDTDELTSWLYRVTVREALSAKRTRWRMLRRLGTWLSVREADASPSPEQLVQSRRQLSRVLLAMQQLPPRERVVVMLKVVDGKTQREIAELTDLSEGYISKLLARALSALRKKGWRDSS